MCVYIYVYIYTYVRYIIAFIYIYMYTYVYIHVHKSFQSRATPRIHCRSLGESSPKWRRRATSYHKSFGSQTVGQQNAATARSEDDRPGETNRVWG